jgi:hypothetical protein
VSTIVRRKHAVRTLGPYRRHELLTGRIKYPVQGYSGYGDGSSDEVVDFISEEMRRDWSENREELIAFWRSGRYTTPETFEDSLPWLFVCGRPGDLPWASQVFE